MTARDYGLDCPMTLAEIMQKITELSPEDRALLRREIEATLAAPDTQSVTPETARELTTERHSGDERGLPVEDVLEPPKPSS